MQISVSRAEMRSYESHTTRTTLSMKLNGYKNIGKTKRFGWTVWEKKLRILRCGLIEDSTKGNHVVMSYFGRIRVKIRSQKYTIQNL